MVSSHGTPCQPVLRSHPSLKRDARPCEDDDAADVPPFLVRNTGLGVGDRREQGGFLFDKIIMPLLKVYKDKNRHEDIVRGSCLDCVLVLPIVLNDKAANQTFQSEVDLSAIHGGTISRADVARFAVEELTNNTWLQRVPIIMSGNTLSG